MVPHIAVRHSDRMTLGTVFAGEGAVQTMDEQSDEALWIYTQAGVFRFCSGNQWKSFFAGIVETGWERPSEGEIGWLHSRLNPYPPGSFFTAADAASFALAVEKYVPAATGAIDGHTRVTRHELVALFSGGPVFILSQPPRKTASTGLVEAVYVYSCPQCGFIHHGRWLFDTHELSLEEIRSSMESMLRYKYCPICGSKDIESVPFLLPPLDPDRAPVLRIPV